MATEVLSDKFWGRADVGYLRVKGKMVLFWGSLFNDA
jgi:hypothetical protein